MASSNKSGLPRPSGLPRASRLAVPQSFSEPPIPSIPSRFRLRAPAARFQVVSKAGGLSEHAQPKSNDLKLQDAGETSRGDNGKILDQNEGNQEKTTYEEVPTKDAGARRRPRPSLSDRTIETLSQIPPSPSPRRRTSSFFPAESPAGTPSRPASSISRSRPATSHGQRPPMPPMPSMAPRATSPTKRPTNGSPTEVTPNRRSVSSFVPKSLPHTTSKAKADETPWKSSRPAHGTVLQPATANASSRSPPKVIGASKTYAPKSSNPRPAVGGAFVKPAMPTRGLKPSSKSRREVSSVSAESKESTDSRSAFSPTSFTSSRTSGASHGAAPPAVVGSQQSKSSAALREAISKAKAERRRAVPPSEGGPHTRGDLDGLQTTDEGLLRKRIESARTEGRLNIAALGLSEFPSEVLRMYDLDTLDASSGAWYESVDIRRLNAADNELENLDGIFPDRSAEDLRFEDDESKGTIFGGLESLDLHGNLLHRVPTGLRYLEHLTSLNLSKNRLANDNLQTISEIRSLKELRIGENALSGKLPSSLYELTGLEVLDVHGNSIADLPEGIEALSSLRSLNLAGNQLRAVPFEALNSLPLTELNVNRNRLSGVLLPPGFEDFLSLKSLDVSANALKSVCDASVVSMPELETFNVGENRLTTLPDISAWTNLATLSANNNNIGDIPEGMTALPRLRNVDFTANSLKKLDDRIGLMESLTSLSIANNPLRERRFLTMATDNIKRELRNRLLPADSEAVLDDADADFGVESCDAKAHKVGSTAWQLKSGGILDRSSTSLKEIVPSDVGHLQDSPIRSLVAHHNGLSSIPTCISLLGATLTILDFSHNKLTGSSYLSAQLDLPRLRELNLASNTITSLVPLLEFLSAPQLQSLNISFNRVAALPAIRTTYPELVTLMASDNSITGLPAESARGLRVCDVSRNDIAHLEPELGLLEAEGLKILAVEGNRFRVPRRDVVEKGTGAVLAWLKDKIPLDHKT